MGVWMFDKSSALDMKYGLTAAGQGTALTSGSATAPGSWVRVIENNRVRARGFWLETTDYAYGRLDLGVSEVNSSAVREIARSFKHWYNIRHHQQHYIPIELARGKDYHMRFYDGGTNTLRVAMTPEPASWHQPAGFTGAYMMRDPALGQSGNRAWRNEVSLSGATMYAGWTSWTEVEDSVQLPLSGLGVISEPASGTAYYEFQVGIGASGQERMIWHGYDQTGTQYIQQVRRVRIPRGSRLCIRARQRTNNTGNFYFYLNGYI